MVDDPIALTCHPDNSFFIEARRQGKAEIFATITGNYINAIYLFDATRSNAAGYYIKFTGNINDGSFWLDGTIRSDNILSKEEFFNGIMERYPEYFEWFLFHPEWLR